MTSRLPGATLTLAGAVVLAGCTHSSGPIGAHPSVPRGGPSEVSTTALPSLAARAVPTDQASAKVEKGVQGLSGRIDAALARAGNATPATRLSQKSAAGNQLMVRWVLDAGSPGAAARRLVRLDVVTILRTVRAAQLPYGSVLLLATGPAVEKGKRTVSLVVRAKYTHTLVRNTDWSRVSPQSVLGMCDDKPAVIAAGYR